MDYGRLNALTSEADENTQEMRASLRQAVAYVNYVLNDGNITRDKVKDAALVLQDTAKQTMVQSKKLLRTGKELEKLADETVEESKSSTIKRLVNALDSFSEKKKCNKCGTKKPCRKKKASNASFLKSYL